ncbi:MAG: endonuclease/exonuclease/phosphatase family protein [Bacteroidetes bacterium]|nr:endonuclease/exonuclease/phosphatase family protein [Bacteroidota bacterium]
MKTSFFRQFTGSIALLGSLLIAFWLIGCISAAFISPLHAKYIALFSLTTPFALVANVVVFLFWLVFARRKWRIIVPLLALGFSYLIAPSIFGWHYFERQELFGGDDRLKVMSWNVHGMGIFDRPANRTTDDKIIQVIKTEAPDILCLSEFYSLYNNALKPYSTAIMNACGYKEFRFKADNTLGTKIFLGTAIFSKFPIVKFQSFPLHTRQDGQVDVQLLQCDLQVTDKKIVRVFFTHLQSFLLSDGEKTYLEEVKMRNREAVIKDSKTYVRRFSEAYVKRAIQTDTAAAIMAQSPYPMLLCGDFNDLPGSYTYMKMKGNLEDAFVQKGTGFGRTYNRFFPTMRIDYIFYSPDAFKILGFRTPSTSLSDHNPVLATFELQPTPSTIPNK